MKKNIAYIYIFDLAKNNIDHSYSLLSDEEAKQHRPFYKQSRYLIRHVLKQHSIPLESLYYAKSGQPKLDNSASISLSHSENIFVIALMQSEQLGVDIQTYLMKDIAAFKKKYQLIHNDQDSLLLHWTKVEAYCKATQSALFSSLYPSIDEKIIQHKLHYWGITQPYPIGLVSNQSLTEIHVFFEDFTSKYRPDPIE